MSITATVPATSDDTQTRRPSAVKTAKRGRVPTSTLAVTLWLATSMKCAMLVVSDVHSTVASSGLTAMPSGSTPTGISEVIRPPATSSTDTWLLFSLAT